MPHNSLTEGFRIKVDVPNLVTYLNWTPNIKWYVV